MAVYVDNMRRPFGRMIMCHMIADSTAELHRMARRIGVARRWIQKEGTYQEHYDLSLGARARAIEAGAIAVSCRELATICRARRAADPPALAQDSLDEDLEP